MLQLILSGLLVFATTTEAIYTWDSPECQALNSQDQQVSKSCVAKGSVIPASPKCTKCMFNEHCASGWCWDQMKVCYDPNVGGCYTGGDYTANCNNCPSDPSTDQTRCQCDNSNYPNNWVDCTDGSGGKLQVSSSGESTTYTSKLSSNGGLAKDDEFAITIQCYHNKVRQAAGLTPLEWDDKLAAFAKEWSEKLCSEQNCDLQHSTKSDRGFVAGENLYASWSSKPLAYAATPNAGKKALEGWYEEIKDYYYAGPNQPHQNACYQTGVVGHFTQVMWANTKKIGCGFAYNSNGNKIEVTCNYDPAGNYVNQAAFDMDAYCKLANWNENHDKYGNINWCGSGSPNC